jgi:imidazolonepropionase-like amidohydrolase
MLASGEMPSAGRYAITAELLIPGSGEPLKDGCVVVDGTTLEYVGPADEGPVLDEFDQVHVPVLMPGMWDCHGHFIGLLTVNMDALVTATAPLAAIRTAVDAGRVLASGFTSVREVGGLGLHLARAISEGTIQGPTIYSAGAMIGPTGGHADIHKYPLDALRSMGEALPFRVCDGVPECLKVVREQLRAGARLIKVCASGGIGSEIDQPEDEQFSPDELKAMVDEAARAGRVVAAHCHGRASIVNALEAGVRTIEHGTCLDEETVAMMLEYDAVLVPTRMIVEDMLAHGRESGQPEYARRKELAYADRHAESLSLAVSRGVRIATGTDSYTSRPGLAVCWGTSARELQHLVTAGMTPLQAIEAATANGPLTIGRQAPRSGRLEHGFDADLVALAVDPTTDVGVLTEQENVLGVWKGGVLAHERRQLASL